MYIRQPQFQQGRMQPAQPKQFSNLQQILNRQAITNRISLPEMYIGDEGAFELAAFLRTQNQINILELKGNNISSVGFVQIFSSLRNNFQLKSLNTEWNKLGIPDLSGLEALYALLINNRSITHLDLKNNKINATGAHVIANAIRNNQTLISLDLRWNEIGNNGARALLGALQENNTLINLEISGNGISEDLHQQIQYMVDNNRQGGIYLENKNLQGAMQQTMNNAYSSLNERDLTYKVQPPLQQSQVSYQQQQSQINYQQQFDNRSNQNQVVRNIYSGKENINLIVHLETQIEDQRVLGLQYKDDFQRNLRVLKDQIQQNNQKKQILEDELQKLQSFNEILRQDLTKSERQINDFHEKKKEQYIKLEEQIKLQEEKIRDLDKQFQSELLNIAEENIHKVREIDAENTEKCEELVQKLRLKCKHNDEMRIEINKIVDQTLKKEYETKDDAKELVDRLKESYYQQYLEEFNKIEKKMNDLESEKLQNERKTQETIKSHIQHFKESTEQANNCQFSVKRLKIENENLHLNNTEFELFIEKQCSDLENKEKLIHELEDELKKLKQVFESTETDENNNKQHVEDTFIVLKEEYQEITDSNKNRIQDLEKKLRESNAENMRLRTDFQRLQELLTSNLQKITYQTFTEQKVL